MTKLIDFICCSFIYVISMVLGYFSSMRKGDTNILKEFKNVHNRTKVLFKVVPIIGGLTLIKASFHVASKAINQGIKAAREGKTVQQLPEYNFLDDDELLDILIDGVCKRNPMMGVFFSSIKREEMIEIFKGKETAQFKDPLS